jgi:hypothetical protein
MTAAPIGSKDPLFDHAYVDVDEWRDEPARHRYVHGGFEGTEALFSLYFPPAERYEGRFFHPVLPMSGIETAATLRVLYGVAGSIEFAVASGAYLVESNLGRRSPFPGKDWTIAGYRASAAVARYSRVLAADMYGEHRPYGYILGGSGGALKTVSGFENAPDVWDGAVPFVMGGPMSMPSVFTVQAHAMRLLWDVFPDIVDALEPGGSGDMYAGLTTEQREALAEVTKMGFPPRAWFDVERLARGYTAVWSVLADNMIRLDPDYFTDFWTVPGYLGVDAPPSLEQARVQHKTRVTGVVFADEATKLGLPMPMAMPRGTTTNDIPVAVLLEELPDATLMGAMLRVVSGKAADRWMYIVGVQDDLALTGVGEAHFEGVAGLAAGDEVVIDNSVYLAAQTYHRHQVHPDFPVWDQFAVSGQPIYPQRPNVIGPTYARQGSGSTKSGRFAGKMIVVQTLMDEAAFPWQAVWYRDRVADVLGDGALDDRYRLWFVDHAMHTGAEPMPGMVMADTRPARKTRMVSYLGVLQQALRDVAAWVELDVVPPASSEFELVDGQVHVPRTAAARRGIQAVIDLTVDGSVRADTGVGQPVNFAALIEVPAGAGTIVAAEWDFDGTAEYPLAEAHLDGSANRLNVRATHTYDEPGTYFPALRVTTQRQGDLDTPHARIQNLGRVRVVVRPDGRASATPTDTSTHVRTSSGRDA